MANGKIGKIYESFLFVALKELKAKKRFVGDIFWNVNPKGVDVEPDLMIGRDCDHPVCVFCVTHSASAKESDKKNWRNLGELCELKTALTPIPFVVNVLFESLVKDELKGVQSAAFDAQLLVDECDYSKGISAWVRRSAESFPSEQDDMVEFIEVAERVDASVKRFVHGLSRDIAILMRQNNADLSRLWEMERLRERNAIPRPKRSTIRRGLSKLLLFDDIGQAIDIYRGRRVAEHNVPHYLFSLGMLRRSVGGVKPADSDILGAVKLLERDVILKISQTACRYPALQDMLHKVRSVDQMRYIGNFVLSRYQDVCDADKLYVLMKNLHKDPNSLCCPNAPEGWPPKDVWLATYLIEVVKMTTNQLNGYGVSQLGHEIVSAGFGSMADLSDAGQFAGGFGFPAWLQRKKSSFREDLIRGLAYVLSSHVRSIGFEELQRLVGSGSVSAHALTNLIETKICTYRLFDPLAELVRVYLPNVVGYKCQSCFAEFSGAKSSVASISTLRVGEVVIKCQSANHLKHSTDKRKELCGRAVGLRYEWDGKKKSFKRRHGISKLVLLLDGVWSENHLRSLILAGWDEIYYPDEIDKLKASVLGTKVEKPSKVLPKLTPKKNVEDEGLPMAAAETKGYGKKR